MARRIVVVVLCVLGLMSGLALAQSAPPDDLDPLLKLLVEQGVITMEQALAVQAESDRREAAADGAEAAPAARPPSDAEVPAVEPVAEEVAPPAAGENFSGVKDLKIGTLAYLSYQDGTNSDGSDYSQFRIKRGYIDIRKKITPYFSVACDARRHPGRATATSRSASSTSTASSTGRAGACSANPTWSSASPTCRGSTSRSTSTGSACRTPCSWSATGCSTRPTSACCSAPTSARSSTRTYRERVNDHYAGRWGSFGIGVYNGGGYHAVENNDSKVIEGRLTVRPLPDVVPGLQVSVFGVSGEGNTPDRPGQPAPDWDVLAGMVSYESPRLVLTAQYEQGDGNQKGSAVSPDGTAKPHDGYSFFTEVRLDSEQKYSLIGRYDHFDTDRDDPSSDVTERWIAGFAWRFYKGNYWLLDYDRLEHSAAGLDTEDRIQLTLQIKY